MQTMSQTDDERRTKNIRLALALAGVVALIMLSSIPFWKGLALLATGNN